MPIHREIWYSVNDNSLSCALWEPTAPLEVHLVMTDYVVHPGATGADVEEIVVYYTKDTAGNYPTADFTLKVHGKTTTVIMNGPIRTVLSGTPGTNPAVSDVSTSGDYYEWHFTPPGGGDNESTTLFEFDNGSGPPTKLKVTVKRQPTSYSC